MASGKVAFGAVSPGELRMRSSSSRPTPRRALVLPGAFLVAWAMVLPLAACQGTGSRSSGSGGSAAAYTPLGGTNLEVPAPIAASQGTRTAERPMSSPPVELRAPAGTTAPGRTSAEEPEPLPLDRSGPQIRVTWEALAVEKERLENPSRFRGTPNVSLASQQKVVLVNKGHVDAQTNMYGVTSRRNKGVAVAAIPERDMDLFLRTIEKRGFFRLARPTASVQQLFTDPNARGRITVERNGQSWTLVSMRGQGLSAATKQIPPLYSEVKQTLMVLRNQVSCMTVVGVRGGILTK